MKKIIYIFLILMFIAALLGCNKNNQPVSLTDSFFAMDTVMTVELYGEKEKIQKAAEEIKSMIFHFDAMLSPKSGSSELYKLNLDKSIKADEDFADIIKTAIYYGELTDGALDISTYSASVAWGFGEESYRLPSIDELDNLIKGINYKDIEINGDTIIIPYNMLIGLGAVAKGYCTDRALEIIKKYKIESALINLGGNVACLGKPVDSDRFGIGLEDPYNKGEAVAVLRLNDKAVVSSGNYQRYFEQDGIRYHHIIDPKTAAPVDTDVNLISIICDDATMADCLSTALYVMGEDKAIDFWRRNKELFDFIIIKDDEIIGSENLEKIFTNLSELSVTWVD